MRNTTKQVLHHTCLYAKHVLHRMCLLRVWWCFAPCFAVAARVATVRNTTKHPRTCFFTDDVCLLHSASARKGNNLKGFEDFRLKVKARIWPWLSYMCRICSTADWSDAWTHLPIYFLICKHILTNLRMHFHIRGAGGWAKISRA